MAEEDKISKLQAKIEQLQYSLLMKDRAIRELQSELNDRMVREDRFIDEINRLEEELERINRSNRNVVREASRYVDHSESSRKDFLDPSLPDTFSKRKGSDGLENEWDEFMYGFVDEDSVEDDDPDILLYRDDHDKCYVSDTGSTRLYFPISESDLSDRNIIHVRPLTDDELNQVCIDYGLL